MRVSDKYVFFWQGFIGNWFKSPIIEVIDEYGNQIVDNKKIKLKYNDKG